MNKNKKYLNITDIENALYTSGDLHYKRYDQATIQQIK